MQVKRRILEVGHGGAPMITEFMAFVLQKPRDLEYHGIEFPSATHVEDDRIPRQPNGDTFSQMHNRRILETEGKWRVLQPEGIVLHRMNAKNLTFQSDHFDEVHLHYVLTDPQIKDSEIERILREVKRVVKPEGVVVATGEKLLSCLFADRSGWERAAGAIDAAGFRPEIVGGELEKYTVFHENIYIGTDFRSRVKNDRAFIIVARK